MVERTIREKTWLIYKATCLETNNSYIGLTCQSLANRWSQHVSAARYPGPESAGMIIRRAIRKYGADAFTLIVLSTHSSLADANAAEQEAIRSHSTLSPCGYNISAGGAGVRARLPSASASTRQKIGEAQRGKVIPAETCAKMSAAAKGKRLSPAHRANIAAAARGKGAIESALARLLNRTTANAAAESGMSGVRKTPQGTWMARIKIDGQTKYLGTFLSPSTASGAYAEALKVRIGELQDILAQRELNGDLRARDRFERRVAADREIWLSRPPRPEPAAASLRHSPEVLAKHSIAMKEAWRRPDARRRMMAAFSDSAKEKRAITLRATLERDKSVRAKYAAAGKRGAAARWGHSNAVHQKLLPSENESDPPNPLPQQP